MLLACCDWSCFVIAKNPVLHGQIKHMKMHYHFVQEFIKEEGEVVVLSIA